MKPKITQEDAAKLIDQTTEYFSERIAELKDLGKDKKSTEEMIDISRALVVIDRNRKHNVIQEEIKNTSTQDLVEYVLNFKKSIIEAGYEDGKLMRKLEPNDK